MQKLARFTHLEELYLSYMGPELDDSAIAAIAEQLPSLRILQVSLDDPTDAALESLSGLSSLEALDISTSEVSLSAAGIRRLSQLEQLRWLEISERW